MDKKILGCLIEILQKQSNQIRKAQVLGFVLSDMLREKEILAGVSSEEFGRRLLDRLAEAERAGPPHDPENEISTEIDKILEHLDVLEKQQEKPN